MPQEADVALDRLDPLDDFVEPGPTQLEQDVARQDRRTRGRARPGLLPFDLRDPIRSVLPPVADQVQQPVVEVIAAQIEVLDQAFKILLPRAAHETSADSQKGIAGGRRDAIEAGCLQSLKVLPDLADAQTVTPGLPHLGVNEDAVPVEDPG